MDESRPETTPGPTSNEKDASAPSEAETAEDAPAKAEETETKGATVAAAIKAWADATTALLKALLLIATLGVLVVIVAAVIRHDDSKRLISLHVDPETEKTLTALGSDLDLRQVFADALNERLRGVEKIVKLQGLDKIIDLGQADAISLKPFGLDVSTGELTRALHLIKGPLAPMEVRMGLVCTPRPCADVGASEGILVVGFSGPHGARRASYPVALGNPALRRGLRRAMQQAADALLDVEEPLAASIFYLNRQDVLPDEWQDVLARAEGAALRARGTSKAGCTVDLVVGASLIRRGLWDEGIAAEKRAARSPDPACQVHGLTNIVFTLEGAQMCNPSRAVRDEAYKQMREALAAIPDLDRGKVGDVAYNRIPTSRLVLDIADVLRQNDDESVRRALCESGGTVGAEGSLARALPGLLDHIQKLLPASARLQNEGHSLLELYRQLLAVLAPGEEGLHRLHADMAKAIDDYLLTDSHPRVLFQTQGHLAMDTARAAHTMLERHAGEPAALRAEIDANLGVARVAFANAVATESQGELLEPTSDIQLLTSSGDALLLAGDRQGAIRAYVRAVDAFIERDEDATQLIPFAQAVGRWAILRKASGACEQGAMPDAVWNERWAHLGGGAHDPCSFEKPERLTGIPALIGSVVADLMRRCPLEPGAATDEQSAQDRRFTLVDCLNGRPKPAPMIFAPLLDSAATDAAIERALSQRRPAAP